ncbi:MAG: GGDEF domain-containing protein [Pelomonas sp.]|nr:GGDEF domain-containing protein [Roseateles sp.]
MPSNNMPGILSRLGKMTAIRNAELLEQSLLKTLSPLLGVVDCILCRFESETVMRVIDHHRSKTITGDIEQYEDRISESINLGLPEPVEAIVRSVRLLGSVSVQRLGEGFLMAYPLHVGPELVGCFVFERPRTPSDVEDGIIRGVLEVFSNYYQLLDASRRDRLTGLLNRQALEDNFDKIAMLPVQRAGDDGADGKRDAPKSCWVGVIDIDHFKKINDAHGHVIGDEVLLLVSRLMVSALRGGDQIFRYGGEEFVSLMATADVDGARHAMERLRETVERHVFPRVGQVTISAGFARVDPFALPGVVIANADRALYHAKEQGRNRTFCYEELVEQGVFQQIESGGLELF